MPDWKANQVTAAQDLAHALGKLVHWPSTENEDCFAQAVLVYTRAVQRHRDPWNPNGPLDGMLLKDTDD